MAVAFDAVGPGNNSVAGFAPSITASWTHTLVAPGAVLTAFESRCGAQTPASQTITSTCGGVAMTQLGFIATNSEQAFVIYGILNQTAGAKTIAISVGNGANTGRSLVGSSVSYTGVSSFGTIASNSGAGTADSLTVTGPASVSEMIFAAFATAQSGSISGFSPTSRFATATGDGFSGINIGDGAATPPSLTLTATNSVGGAWAGLGVRLIPPTQFYAMF
jgi:hypothetical protein